MLMYTLPSPQGEGDTLYLSVIRNYSFFYILFFLYVKIFVAQKRNALGFMP